MEEAKKVEAAAADPMPVSSQKTPLGTGPWYRYRHFVYTLLACNVAMVCYAVLNQDVFFPRKPSEEQDEEEGSLKEGAHKEKREAVSVPAAQAKLDQPKPSSPEAKVDEAKRVEIPAAAAVTKPQGPSVSREEQIELYKWMLEEKRKMRPSSPEEKVRIDVEKGVLKDYIRGKVPSLTS